MELPEIDPRTAPRALLEQAVAVQQVVDREYDPGVPARPYDSVVASWVHGDGDDRCRVVLAVDGDRVAGLLVLRLTTQANLEVAMPDLAVPPDARRRGTGRLLLARAGELATEDGRTRLVAAAPEDGPGAAFLSAQGFERALVEPRRVSVVADVRLPAPLPEGYELVRWTGAAPDDLVDAYAVQKRTIGDAPMQDLAWDDGFWDATAVRAVEAAHAARRLSRYVMVARHVGTGDLAALTEVIVDDLRPERAWQWDTSVAPAHRGHGLGLAIKGEMVRVLQQERPDVLEIETTNASDNPWMIRINELLGYRQVDTWTEWERAV